MSLNVLDTDMSTVRNETQLLADSCSASDHEATGVTFRLLEVQFHGLQKDAYDLLTELKVCSCIIRTYAADQYKTKEHTCKVALVLYWLGYFCFILLLVIVQIS